MALVLSINSNRTLISLIVWLMVRLVWSGAGQTCSMHLPAGPVTECQNAPVQPCGGRHRGPPHEAALRPPAGGAADGIRSPLQHGPGLCSSQGRTCGGWLCYEAGGACQQHGHGAEAQCGLGPAESCVPRQPGCEEQHHVHAALDHAHLAAPRRGARATGDPDLAWSHSPPPPPPGAGVYSLGPAHSCIPSQPNVQSSIMSMLPWTMLTSLLRDEEPELQVILILLGHT